MDAGSLSSVAFGDDGILLLSLTAMRPDFPAAARQAPLHSWLLQNYSKFSLLGLRRDQWP